MTQPEKPDTYSTVPAKPWTPPDPVGHDYRGMPISSTPIIWRDVFIRLRKVFSKKKAS